MKVLILITKSNWGGAQRYVYDLATNLSKNHDVEVIAGGNGPLIDELINAGVKVGTNLPIKRDVNVLGDIKAFFRLISIIKERKPDVLHINSSKIGGLGALAGRLIGVKRIIFTAHGWAFNENRTMASKIIIKILQWFTVVLSHKTICVSELLKNQFYGWPFISNKFTVIHNGIKPEAGFSKVNAKLELLKDHPEILNKVKADKNLIIIGSIGELHHIKGYEYSIKAIHDLIKLLKVKNVNKNIIYLIISTGEEKENLEKLIKELGMENTVYLLGYIKQASQYIKAFDIFLLPSLSEGLPYVCLEAGRASLPVVATAVGGIPEIIDDMESGILIQPRKSNEIVHALEFYLTHKKARLEYGLVLREKVINKFTIENMVSKTEDEYKS